jgi:choline dehydrogenase-like flavoprotein
MIADSDGVDVVIVGAGPSGGVAAKHLTAAGFSVVCLEQGEWPDPGSFVADRPEGELVGLQRWHYNPNVRLMESDYPINVSESDIYPAMFNGVGGSTAVWGAAWHRFKPSDFTVRSLDGVADDWPIRYEDLVPFYEEAEADMGVSGMDGDPGYPDGMRYPMPPLPIGKAGTKMATAMNALGWHWWPGSNAIASRPYRHLAACVRMGVCMRGCPEGAKSVADKAYWIDAVAAGARLITGARVKEVLIDAADLATGVVYVDRMGTEHRQSGNHVILCANGIGTARLLLLSKSARFPNGLANSSGLVGRNLMMHPLSLVIGTFDEPLDSWEGPAGQPIYSTQFYETDKSRGFVRGAKWNLLPGGGPLANHLGLLGAPLEIGWGANLHRIMRGTLGHTAMWAITSEDLPNPENRVELDPELTDSDDIPSVKVIFRFDANSIAMRQWHVARASESMRAAGARDIVEMPLLADSGAHLLGTARMGIDPATSVTNPWGTTHDVPNLHIYDGSLFVTSAGVNPTATICALASRCVQHLIATRRDQRVSA